MQQVKSVMAKSVEVLHPTSTIKEAADKMKRSNIGALPVWDGDRVLGIVTGRDIAVRAVAGGRNPENTNVSEIMTRDIITGMEGQSLHEAVNQMRDKNVKRLVVMTPDNQIKGIITLGDIVHFLGRSKFPEFMQESLANDTQRRRVFLGLGTLAGLSTLVAGLSFLRRQPEVKDRLLRKTGLDKMQAA